MAVANPINLKYTAEAAADLSSYQFYAMKDSSGQVTVSEAVTDPVVGVLQNKPSVAGRAAELVVLGETKIKAGGAISKHALLTTDGNGKFVAVTPGNDTTTYILGRALEAAGADGDIIRAEVNCINPARAA